MSTLYMIGSRASGPLSPAPGSRDREMQHTVRTASRTDRMPLDPFLGAVLPEPGFAVHRSGHERSGLGRAGCSDSFNFPSAIAPQSPESSASSPACAAEAAAAQRRPVACRGGGRPVLPPPRLRGCPEKWVAGGRGCGMFPFMNAIEAPLRADDRRRVVLPAPATPGSD